METRTAGIVAKELKALGFEVKTGIGKTGVVGIMRNGDGPVVLWRADMDAIATKEATGVPYASKVMKKMPDGSEVPVGHLCGHDAHTTWLLSLAKTMATLKDQWHGTLILLGQLAVITLCFLTVGWARQHADYHRRVVVPASVVIAIIAAFWVFQRTDLINIATS